MALYYTDNENTDDGGGYQYPETGGDPPLSMELPGANPLQKVAMEEFIKSPSQDRWLDLVESMIRQREDNRSQSLSDGSPRWASPRRSNRSPRKSSSRSPRKVPPRQFYTEVKPEPPSGESEEDNDMRGWTMHAAKSRDDEDEEVSEQLKSMLSHSCTPSDGGEVSVNYPSSSCSPCLFTNKSSKPPLSTMYIFLLGLVLGIIFIVGLSFTFDRTPSEELRVVALRAHGSHQHIGDSRDSNLPEGFLTSNTSQDEDTSHTSQDEREEDLTGFCDSCQWKNTNFNCKKRVDWEMVFYGLTEEGAKRANLKHCTMPTSVEERGP